MIFCLLGDLNKKVAEFILSVFMSPMAKSKMLQNNTLLGL